MKRIHLILTGLSLTIILLSLNRLTNLTQGYLQPFDYLRWLDFNAMLPIPLASVLLYYLLKREIIVGSLTDASPHPFRKTALYSILSVLLIAGIYFFGAGSGTHEVTNYLHYRFCGGEAGLFVWGGSGSEAVESLCKIIIYNDDEFSHVIYYIGFILMNVTLMLLEYFMPRKQKVSRSDLVWVTINGLFIALGIFANLAFEEARFDLIFFGSVMLLSLYLLFSGKHGARSLPIIFYFASSYTIGVVATILYKLATVGSIW